MSKQDIVNYVMDTPHNINPAILNQKLGEMEVQPDWNQNDPTALDYIKNRPFYEGENLILDMVATSTGTISFSDIGLNKITLERGKTYKVYVNDVLEEVKCEQEFGSGLNILDLRNGLIYEGAIAGFKVGDHIKVADVAAVHTIDPKYLPEVIYLTPVFDDNTLTGYCLGKFSTDTPLTYAMAGEVYEKYLSGATVLVTEIGRNLVSPILTISFNDIYATIAFRGMSEIYSNTIWPEPIS